jgi:hypothetical protein
MRWQKVRKANIPEDDRDMFERYGEFVIGLVLAGGLNPRVDELKKIDGEKINHARDWLTERGDLEKLRELRQEMVDWAILIFVILGVIADFLLLCGRGIR